MAVNVTFAMEREEALTFLTREINDDRDVKVVREMNKLRVVVPTRPWWAELLFITWVLRDQEQAQVTVSDDEFRPGHVHVDLESQGAPPWLYRRLMKILDGHSVEQAQLNAERRDSPFSMENMWGGPLPRKPGQAPPAPLGFGGDFFGGPPSKKATRVPEDPAGPGAFTRARDAGDFN